MGEYVCVCVCVCVYPFLAKNQHLHSGIPTHPSIVDMHALTYSDRQTDLYADVSTYVRTDATVSNWSFVFLIMFYCCLLESQIDIVMAFLPTTALPLSSVISY